MVKINTFECVICGRFLDWGELVDGDFCEKCFDMEEE